MDTTKRITKNSAKAGKQSGLTTNSLSKVAFGSSSRRDLLLTTPPITKSGQSDEQLAAGFIDRTKETVKPDSNPQSDDEVEDALLEDEIKGIEAGKEQPEPAQEEDKPNSQQAEPSDVVKMTPTTKNMVPPGTRDAPKFVARRPEELRQFLRQMEDLWNEAGIKEDKIKKESVGKYADYECEEEWAAFDTYVDPYTWDEFKEELFANYPEAAAAERGTPQRIREICDDQREIVLGDMQGLYGFRRKFMAEAKKLLAPPAVMSNRELVELFMGRLSGDMASLVFQRLSSLAASEVIKVEKPDATVNIDKAATAEEAVPKTKQICKRPEDRHDLSKVCEAAVAVSEDHQGFFRTVNKTSRRDSSRGREVMTFSQPQSSESRDLAQKLEEIEGVQALEKDRLTTVNKTIEAKFGELQDMFKTMLSMAQKQEQTHQPVGHGGSIFERGADGILGKPGTMPRWGKSVDNERCFYCGHKGHYVPDCTELKEELRSGRLLTGSDGKLRLGDGTRIPPGPMGSIHIIATLAPPHR